MELENPNGSNSRSNSNSGGGGGIQSTAMVTDSGASYKKIINVTNDGRCVAASLYYLLTGELPQDNNWSIRLNFLYHFLFKII